MAVRLQWFIFFFVSHIFTITYQRQGESTYPGFLVSNISLKCQSKNEDSFIPIGESVGFYFEESFPAVGYSMNISHSRCSWIFKPLHMGNYVELYFHNIEPESCHVSSIDVFVSGIFSEKICSKKKVDGLKFLGKDISVQYNYLKSPNTTHILELILREASPVNPGCDFKTREIGGIPMQGNVLSNIPYSLSLVNRENLGVTPCFNDIVLMPVEDVPSCHSALESGCGWEVGGATVVYEVNDLNGYHWKINKEGTFRTKSNILELEAICLYIEYLVDSSDGYGIIRLYAMLPHGRAVLAEYLLQNQMWETARITSALPDHLKGARMQLILEIITNGVVYVNKIFGCNPFTLEDRHLISTGNNIMLFGSIEKEFLRFSKKCKNGGQLFRHNCVCPIGFRGEHCEYGCGENKFGFDCASHCSLFNNGCKQIIFCDDIFGCSCAAGFTGEYCHIGCGEYEYGANCQQKCGFCFDNETCDTFTGHCISGCKDGYVTPYCDHSFVHFIQPPNTTILSFQDVSFTANINKDSVVGEGIPTSFIVQYKKHETEIWRSSAPESIPKNGQISWNQGNLKADVSYDLRIILLTENNETFNIDVPFVTFKTACRAYIKYMIKVVELRASGARISWQKQDDGAADCNIKEDDVYITSGSNWLKFRVNQSEFEFSNLLSGTKYRVRINPVLEEKSPFSYLSFTTLSKCSGAVNNVGIFNVGPYNADIKWDQGTDKYAKHIISYSCIRIVADPKRDCTEEQGSIIVATNQYTLTNLHPSREYHVTVKEELCLEGIGFGEIEFVTKVDVPKVSPVNGIISALHSTSANFIWSSPPDCSECNGSISGYHVEVMDTSFKKLFSGFVKEPYLSLEGLLPGKNYILHVFLVNENGWNDSSFMELKFSTFTS